MGGGGWWDPAAPVMGTALVVVRGWVGVGRRRTSVDVAEIGRKARGGARKAWGSRAWRIGAFVTVPGLIAGSGLVASAYGLGVMGSSHASECTPQVVQAPARDSFDVRVLNASGIDKRAGTVAKELATRGFAIVEASGVGDGGMQSRVDIAYGDEGLDGALLLAGQVKDARLFDDGRKGTTVTLVIGGDFAGLAEVPAPPPPRAQELKVNVYNTTFRWGSPPMSARSSPREASPRARSATTPTAASCPTTSRSSATAPTRRPRRRCSRRMCRAPCCARCRGLSPRRRRTARSPGARSTRRSISCSATTTRPSRRPRRSRRRRPSRPRSPRRCRAPAPGSERGSPGSLVVPSPACAAGGRRVS